MHPGLSRTERVDTGVRLALAEQHHDVTAAKSSGLGVRKARGLARTRSVRITTWCADLAEYRIEAVGWGSVV